VTQSILARLIKGTRGVATSLMEATATVAVGAVLASVAVNGAIDAINESKIEAAKADVSAIGQATLNFYKDNAFFPLFKDGTETGAGDDFFAMLVSENGTYPSTDVSDTWNIGATTSYPMSSGKFGHQVSPEHDTIEGHLVLNVITNGNTLSAYPTRGLLLADPNRGWAGPYFARLPRTDPWGNKYMINVRELHTRHLREVHTAVNSSIPKRVVMVISAGPNRQLETPSEQPFELFRVLGDDIISRLK
jgi:Tfp pilus assembly protein PilE